MFMYLIKSFNYVGANNFADKVLSNADENSSELYFLNMFLSGTPSWRSAFDVNSVINRIKEVCNP